MDFGVCNPCVTGLRLKIPKTSVESKPKPLNTAFFVVSKGNMGNVSVKYKYLNEPSKGNAS